MIEISPLTAEAAEYVLQNLWGRTEDELNEIGFGTLEARRQRVGAWLDNQFSFCIHENGVPIVITGAEEMEPNVYATWFFAAKSYDEFSGQVTRVIRRFLKEQMAAHPDATLAMFTICDLPIVERWFGVLGFSKIHTEGRVSVFKYEKT